MRGTHKKVALTQHQRNVVKHRSEEILKLERKLKGWQDIFRQLELGNCKSNKMRIIEYAQYIRNEVSN